MSAEPSEPGKPQDFADAFRETVLAFFPPDIAESVRYVGEKVLNFAFKVHADYARPPHPTQSLEAIGRELRFLERYLDRVAVALDTTAEVPDLEPSAAVPPAALARLLAVRARTRARRLAEMAVDLEGDLLLLGE